MYAYLPAIQPYSYRVRQDDADIIGWVGMVFVGLAENRVTNSAEKSLKESQRHRQFKLYVICY